MAATSQAQAQATKAAQRARIERAKQSGDRAAYIGRKPSYTRDQFNDVRDMLASIAQIAREDWPNPTDRLPD